MNVKQLNNEIVTANVVHLAATIERLRSQLSITTNEQIASCNAEWQQIASLQFQLNFMVFINIVVDMKRLKIKFNFEEIQFELKFSFFFYLIEKIAQIFSCECSELTKIEFSYLSFDITATVSPRD